MNIIAFGFIAVGLLYFVGLLCYWQGHKNGYAIGFSDGQMLSKYKKGNN